MPAIPILPSIQFQAYYCPENITSARFCQAPRIEAVEFEVSAHSLDFDSLVMRIEDAVMVSYTFREEVESIRTDISLNDKVKKALSNAPYGRLGQYQHVATSKRHHT